MVPPWRLGSQRWLPPLARRRLGDHNPKRGATTAPAEWDSGWHEGQRPIAADLDRFEQGADYGSPAASVEAFAELRGCFRRFTEVWLFCGRDAPLVRGFYYPLSSHIRFGIPKNLGPLAVLIDECGDQLWLNAVSCGEATVRGRRALCSTPSISLSLPATLEPRP